MYGDALMYAGVRLSPAYGGTGYNSEVRFFRISHPEYILWKARNKFYKKVVNCIPGGIIRCFVHFIGMEWRRNETIYTQII